MPCLTDKFQTRSLTGTFLSQRVQFLLDSDGHVASTNDDKMQVTFFSMTLTVPPIIQHNIYYGRIAINYAYAPTQFTYFRKM